MFYVLYYVLYTLFICAKMYCLETTINSLQVNTDQTCFSLFKNYIKLYFVVGLCSTRHG